MSVDQVNGRERASAETEAVFNHHTAAFMAGDADELLKDFTDDSVVMAPEGVFKGREAIHALFSGFFSGLYRPGTYQVVVDTLRIEGEVAYSVWHASCASATIPFATDTYVVRDGKMAYQTFAAKIETR